MKSLIIQLPLLCVVKARYLGHESYAQDDYGYWPASGDAEFVRAEVDPRVIVERPRLVQLVYVDRVNPLYRRPVHVKKDHESDFYGRDFHRDDHYNHGRVYGGLGERRVVKQSSRRPVYVRDHKVPVYKDVINESYGRDLHRDDYYNQGRVYGGLGDRRVIKQSNRPRRRYD